jgi:uncharacterized protein (TIGR02246 family)
MRNENDEQAIRGLVETWMSASKSGDLTTILSLMAEDVMYLVPGREPFGKEEFAQSFREMKNVRLDPRCEIQEIKVLGDWAWVRNQLQVTIRPPEGPPVLRSGHTLTILNKKADGQWVIARDANLLSGQASQA